MRKAAEKLARASQALFYNPWCTADVLSTLAGLSRDDRRLLADGARFERLAIPAAGGRGYQTVYGLTAAGQRTAAGRYRAPQALAAALLLQHGRLARARQGLAQLAGAGRLLWSLSPWQPKRAGPAFDALLALKAGRERAYLAVLVTPLPGARLAWYLDLLAAWQRWRKAAGAVPAALLLWQPPLEPEGLAVLAAAVRDAADPDRRSSVAWIDGADLAQETTWQPLGQAALGRAWREPGRVSAAALAPGAYLSDGRKSAFPGAATLGGWAHKHSATVAFFLDARAGQIDLLEDLARFPGVSPATLKRLNPQDTARRKLGGRLQALVDAGLVAVTPDGRVLPTEPGLALLAGLRGVSPRAANRDLGWPVRPGQFKNLLAHQAVVLAFLLRLRDEGVLQAWSYNSHQHLFWVPRPEVEKRLRRVVIQPDSAAGVRLGPKQVGAFWLEVDRGTRQAGRLDWKLEKYFLAAGASYASGKVPLVAYLVDRDGRQEENRLQRVARRLARLARQYPGSSLRVFLATGDLLRRAPAPLLDAPVWREFTRGRLSTGLVSLRDGLAGRRA